MRYAWLSRARVLAGLFVILGGCAAAESQDLAQLTVRDSTYLDPGTGLPYSGSVHQPFADTSGIQLRGTLADGTWIGQLTVYFPSGRVRFEGEMANGGPCGGWIENERDVDPESELLDLKRELEAIVMYPACP